MNPQDLRKMSRQMNKIAKTAEMVELARTNPGKLREKLVRQERAKLKRRLRAKLLKNLM